MERYSEHLRRIKHLLKAEPRGLSILQLSHELGVNRNSVAKYLDVLQISGQVEMRQVGPAKLYFLSHRASANALIAFSDDAIIVMDEERVVQMNRVAEQMLGERDSVIGGPLPDYLATKEECARALHGEQVEREAEHGDRTYRVKLVGTTFEDGAPGVTLIAEDITEERERREWLRLLEKAVEASSSGITIADMTKPDEPLIYVNPAFERLSGYRAHEILGKNCRFLQADDRDQEAVETIRRALNEGRECVVELRNYRKDGTRFWNELRLAPVMQDGKVTHYVGVQTDISHRK